jgi:hypothetical protein
LTGEGDHPNRLDVILYEDRTELPRARIDEDNKKPPPGLTTVTALYDPKHGNPREWPQGNGVPEIG